MNRWSSQNKLLLKSKFWENLCRCFKSDNSKEKYEGELEGKGKDYISKKRILQSTDHCKRRWNCRIKERIKMEIATKAIYYKIV